MDDAVRNYKYRRATRLRSRYDSDDGGKWVTTKKKHRVHLNEEGMPDKGNPHVIDFIEDKALDNELKRIVGLGHEKVLVYDQNGKLAFSKDGEKHGVKLSSEETKMLKNLTMIHNHPEQVGFSLEDISLFVNKGLKKLEVVLPDGEVQSISKLQGEEQNQDGFFKAWFGVDVNTDEFEDYYCAVLRNAGIDPDAYEWTEKESKEGDRIFERCVREFQARWAEQNADHYGYRFTRRKIK